MTSSKEQIWEPKNYSIKNNIETLIRDSLDPEVWESVGTFIRSPMWYSLWWGVELETASVILSYEFD